MMGLVYRYMMGLVYRYMMGLVYSARVKRDFITQQSD